MTGIFSEASNLVFSNKFFLRMYNVNLSSKLYLSLYLYHIIYYHMYHINVISRRFYIGLYFSNQFDCITVIHLKKENNIINKWYCFKKYVCLKPDQFIRLQSSSQPANHFVYQTHQKAHFATSGKRLPTYRSYCRYMLVINKECGYTK